MTDPLENDMAPVKRSLENGDYRKYYSVDTYCGNCGYRNTAFVLRGHTQGGRLIDCTRCGCSVRLKAHREYFV